MATDTDANDSNTEKGRLSSSSRQTIDIYYIGKEQKPLILVEKPAPNYRKPTLSFANEACCRYANRRQASPAAGPKDSSGRKLRKKHPSISEHQKSPFSATLKEKLVISSRTFTCDRTSPSLREKLARTPRITNDRVFKKAKDGAKLKQKASNAGISEETGSPFCNTTSDYQKEEELADEIVLEMLEDVDKEQVVLEIPPTKFQELCDFVHTEMDEILVEEPEDLKIEVQPVEENVREGIEVPAVEENVREGIEVPAVEENVREGIEVPAVEENVREGIEVQPVEENEREGTSSSANDEEFQSQNHCHRATEDPEESIDLQEKEILILAPFGEEEKPAMLKLLRGKVGGGTESEAARCERLKFKARELKGEIPGNSCQQENVSLKHKEVQEKRESSVYNDVIEETASKLVEKRKSMVQALVGAFESVILLQEPECQSPSAMDGEWTESKPGSPPTMRQNDSADSSSSAKN